MFLDLQGGGIYFANSIVETNNKALKKGVIIYASVYIGNSLLITNPTDINYNFLKKDNYDSVHITGRSTGDEYVVYDSRQVILEYYSLNSGVTWQKIDKDTKQQLIGTRMMSYKQSNGRW